MCVAKLIHPRVCDRLHKRPTAGCAVAGVTKALQLMGLGWFIVLALLIPGVWLGRLLDDRTGLSPLFFVLGTILGLLVAFVGTRRMIRDVLRSESKE